MTGLYTRFRRKKVRFLDIILFTNFILEEKSPTAKKGKDQDFDSTDSRLKEDPRSSTTKIVEFRNFSNIFVKRKKKKKTIQKITLEYLKQCVFFRSGK